MEYNSGMSLVGLKYPELLAVADDSGTLSVGGDQHWYPDEGFIPRGACGATVASSAFAYLLRLRPRLYATAESAGLCGLAPPLSITEPIKPSTKTGYLGFMKQVYRFFYPRMGGLMADMFVEGAGGLVREYGLPIAAEFLKIPITRAKRPSFDEVSAFIKTSLEVGAPAAFLILSNGCVENLDTWHWVTILGIDEDAGAIELADNREVMQARLDTWLDTSIMGGALVRIIEN